MGYVDIGGIHAALHKLEAGYAVHWLPLGEPRPARHARYLNAEQAARNVPRRVRGHAAPAWAGESDGCSGIIRT